MSAVLSHREICEHYKTGPEKRKGDLLARQLQPVELILQLLELSGRFVEPSDRRDVLLDLRLLVRVEGRGLDTERSEDALLEVLLGGRISEASDEYAEPPVKEASEYDSERQVGNED